MSNDTPKEGVVIDVTPEQEAPAETPASDATASDITPNEKPPGRGLAGLALLLAAAALSLTLVGGWYGYRQWLDIEGRLGAASSQGSSTASETRGLAAQLDSLEQAQQAQGARLDGLDSGQQADREQLAGIRQAFDEQSAMLSDERRALDDREAELRSLVSNLHERVGRSGNQWLVAEAGYLLNLAEHRLRLAADPATARTALALADERLHATGDAGWSGVREQIARDLTRLDTLAQPDITGLWSRLGALLDQVPNLKLREGARGIARSEPPKVSLTPSSEERTWRTLLSDLWAGIKDSVRIRRHDEPVAALLPPEQEYFLFENLRLRLEQARLALVQGRSEIYRQALAEARDWLARHFAAEDAVTRALDQALAELAASPVRAELPDISPSLSAFRARRELLQSLPAPVPPAEEQEAPAA
jgi:uroporphyrin-3 C-methyltransferase